MKKILGTLISVVVLTLVVISNLTFTNAAPSEQNKNKMENYGEYIRSLSSNKKELLDLHKKNLPKKSLNKKGLDTLSNNKKLIQKNDFKILLYHFKEIKKEDNAKQLAFRSLLEDRALFLAAKKSGISVSDAEVKKAIDRNLEIPASNKFKNLLKGLNLTKKEFWRDYKYDKVVEQITIRKFYDKFTNGEQQNVEKWFKKYENIVNNFKQNNKSKIEKVKKEYNIGQQS